MRVITHWWIHILGEAFMTDITTSKFPRLFSIPKWNIPFNFSLPNFNFSWPNFNVGSKLWNNFVEGFAPDRRNFEVCYFPLVHKNAKGALTYFGTFVPDLYELARADGSKTAFQDAILLPKKTYALQADGKLSVEDLRSVAAQVSKKMFAIANVSRKNQENLNIYHADRIPAQALYFNDKSGIARSVNKAKPGELINVYGGAKGTSYQLGDIQPSNREKLIHAGLNWLSRGVALMSGIGAALAFAPAAPFAALIAGLTTYYVVTSAEQFSFWDKAEDLIKNNWLTSAKHRQAKKLDFVKLTKTLVISGMVGYLALQGGMGAYTGALEILATLPSLSGVLITANTLMGIKAAAGVLAATAGLSAFRGLMGIMHNWLALGYAKTVISPEETKALPVADILKTNKNAKVRHENTKVAELNDSLQDNLKEIANLKDQLTQAQNPCVSKVIALEAVREDLISKGKITGDLEGENFDAAFEIITQNLPMNLGAWAPAKVFNALSQEEKLKAIEDFKSASNSRFNEYKTSEQFQAYLTSARYDLDKNMFKAYLKGETYKLMVDEPVRDCCSGKKTTDVINIAATVEFVPTTIVEATDAGNDALTQPTPEVVQFSNAKIASNEEVVSKPNPSLERVKGQSERPARSRSSSPSRIQPARLAKK